MKPCESFTTMVQLGLNTQLTAGALTSTTVSNCACARVVSASVAITPAIVWKMRITASSLRNGVLKSKIALFHVTMQGCQGGGGHPGHPPRRCLAVSGHLGHETVRQPDPHSNAVQRCPAVPSSRHGGQGTAAGSRCTAANMATGRLPKIVDFSEHSAGESRLHRAASAAVSCGRLGAPGSRRSNTE